MSRSLARLGALTLLLCALSVGLAGAAPEVIQKDGLRVATNAAMKPGTLPRRGAAPISVSVSGQISTTNESQPPQIRGLQIEINRHGRFDYQGLPVCRIAQIQPASDSRALSACRRSLVGQGRFSGTIALGAPTPYPLEGRLLVFNGREHGHPVLLGHIYSRHPFGTSFVIVFGISTLRHGTYGTVLTANLAKALGKKRNLTGLEMTLSRRWRSGGKRHSYISAGCPAPKGISRVPFSLVRTTFSFTGGAKFNSTLTRQCRARG